MISFLAAVARRLRARFPALDRGWRRLLGRGPLGRRLRAAALRADLRELDALIALARNRGRLAEAPAGALARAVEAWRRELEDGDG